MARYLSEPPDTLAEALEQGALPAPACKCLRAIPDGWGYCARCGRTVPMAKALVGGARADA